MAADTVEVARAGDSSSHDASPIRTSVMQELGLQTPGFWAGWQQRTKNPAASAATPSATSPSAPKVSQMPQYNVLPLQPDQGDPWNLDPVKLPEDNTPAPPDSATGITKRQLQQTEKQVTWSELRGKIAQTPLLSTATLDVFNAEQINMGRQMMIYMQQNPSKMLTDAATDYWNRHPPGSAVEIAKTHFEKQVSLYTETQKMAKALPDYAAGQAMKTVNSSIKAVQARGAYSSPSYMGGTMLNIGKDSGYGGVRYLSTFG